MEISRKYIETEFVQQVPVADRFFKLPIENYLDVLSIVPNKVQIAIINQLNNPDTRYITQCVSRRVGKSFISYTSAFLKLLEPNTSVLIMAPNYSIANIGWDEIKRLIKASGLETEKDNQKDKEIYFQNGSFFKLGSINRADAVVGRSYDLVIYEEAAIDRRGGDTFDVQIGPMLDKPNSKAIFISTPRGDNWFRKFYERGFSSDLTTWASVHGTYRDNPRVPEAVIDEARRTCSPQKFRQEYEQDFDVFETQVYTCYTEDHIVDTLPVPEYELESIFGVDHGYTDQTAAVCIGYHQRSDTFYVLEDYVEARKTTQQHAVSFLDIMERNNVDFAFVDSAAQQFAADLSMLYDIPTTKAKKSVLDGIEYIQSLLQQNKLYVLSNCQNTIQMFRNYQWEPDRDENPRPVHDSNSHCADALRYQLFTFTR